MPSTLPFVTTTSVTSGSLGKSYMVCCNTFSQMARRPRAPVFCSTALWAMAWSDSAVKVSLQPSISNMRWYCLTRAFLGCVRIGMRSSSDRPRVWVMTGTRPTNSGIMPNLCKSSGNTLLSSSS